VFWRNSWKISVKIPIIQVETGTHDIQSIEHKCYLHHHEVQSFVICVSLFQKLHWVFMSEMVCLQNDFILYFLGNKWLVLVGYWRCGYSGLMRNKQLLGTEVIHLCITYCNVQKLCILPNSVFVSLIWNRGERDHWGDLGIDGWIILGWISRRWDVGIRTGLGWPRIGTGGGRFWVR